MSPATKWAAETIPEELVLARIQWSSREAAGAAEAAGVAESVEAAEAAEPVGSTDADKGELLGDGGC